MQTAGFYIIKEQFFIDMADPYLKGNKNENRPHYCCLPDKINGIYWMIPLSGKVDKFRKIISDRLANKKPCDIIHIVKTDDDRESAFLIQDMFPIDESYIEREYTIGGNHLVLTSEHEVNILLKKARKVLRLIQNGVKFMTTQPDVLAIYNTLCNKVQHK